MTALGNVVASATGTSRRNFAYSHLSTADFFAKQLAAHEAAHSGAGWGDHFEQSMHLGTAAIILSFAAIEAAMNEALVDLAVPELVYAAFERVGTLDQAQTILQYRAKPLLDAGGDTFQRAGLLRQIRNALVHAKSEWGDEEKSHAKLRRKLASTNLSMSPFVPDGNPFPDGIMSAAAARWAVQTGAAFNREFLGRLGLKTDLFEKF